MHAINMEGSQGAAWYMLPATYNAAVPTEEYIILNNFIT